MDVIKTLYYLWKMARHFLYFIFFHSNDVVGRHQYINIYSEQMVLLPSFLPLSESPGALSEWKSPFHSCEPPTPQSSQPAYNPKSLPPHEVLQHSIQPDPEAHWRWRAATLQARTRLETSQGSSALDVTSRLLKLKPGRMMCTTSALNISPRYVTWFSLISGSVVFWVNFLLD